MTMNSSVVLFALCLLHLLLDVVSEEDKRQPPTFYPEVGPAYVTLEKGRPVEAYFIYRSDDEIDLPCYAKGIPSPRYTWFKDGGTLDLNSRNIIPHQDKRNGSIRIIALSSMDKGIYSCQASNMYGTTVSRPYYLQQARWVKGHSNPDDIQTYTQNVGDYFVLQCRTDKAVPRQTITWGLQETPTSKEFRPLERSKRLIQDTKTGDLHITAIQPKDRRLENGNPLLYKCNVKNLDLDTIKGGSYSVINVMGPGQPDMVPVIEMKTPSPHVVVLGYELRIQCIFRGIPNVDVMWEDVQTLPAETGEEYGTVLIIKKVEQQHERTFTCKGTNQAGTATADIQVKVETRPEFKEDKFPHDTFASEGTDVTFHCEPKDSTVPAPDITWYVNGVPLDVDHPGERTEIVDDRRTLTIRRVCRGSAQCMSDLKVIQCNVTNKHGFAFAGGFLNVLLPTTIVLQPEDVELDEDGDLAVFSCEATTDAYVEASLMISWLRDDKTLVYYGDQRLVRNGTSLIVNLTGLEVRQKEEYIGEYSCVADTPYSSARSDAQLTIKGREKPPEVVAAFPWWIIIVLVVLLLLVIFFVVCCCCLYQNSRGDSYPVDEKERLEGNDPVKELEDSGFHDFQRPEVEAVKGSRASLTSTARMDTDEEASLASYGDLDMGRFTEDGSFIGQYMTGTGNRRKKSTSEL